MPNDPKDPKTVLADLKKCMRAAHGTKALMDACEKKFTDANVGTVTSDGGKVFSISDGSEAFVTTGGKVF
jgi:hypothetical protein